MNLTKNSLINSIFVLLSQISGFIRDVFIAAFLGSGIISNIFIIALRLPFSFQQSVSGETFNSAFIPTLSKIKGTNENKQTKIWLVLKNIFRVTGTALLIAHLLS